MNYCRNSFYALAGLVLSYLLLVAPQAIAQNITTLSAKNKLAPKPLQSDFGGVGLLQMPTARVAPDGEFAIGTGMVSPYRRHFIALQVLPRLEAVFRYTSIENTAFNQNISSSSFKDRGVDLKFVLLPEKKSRPQIAVGLRDLGGTQVFSSEYVVLSKRVYNLDFTLGMAWGYAGSRGDIENPLSNLFGNKFNTRGATQWGALSNNFFRGENVGFFGGMQYRTPIDGLELKLEYESNDYSTGIGNSFTQKSPVNVGISYRPKDWVDLSVAYERGNKVMLRGNLRTNLNADKGMPKFAAKPPPVVPREQLNILKKPKKPAPITVAPDIKAEDSLERFYISLEETGLKLDEIRYNNGGLMLEVSAFPGTKSPHDGDLAKAAWQAIKAQAIDGVDHVAFIVRDRLNRPVKAVFYKEDLEYSIALTGSPVALVKPTNTRWRALLNNPAAHPDFSDVVFAALAESGFIIEGVEIVGELLVMRLKPTHTTRPQVAFEPIAHKIDQASAGHGIEKLQFVDLSGPVARQYDYQITGHPTPAQETPAPPQQSAYLVPAPATTEDEDKTEKEIDRSKLYATLKKHGVSGVAFGIEKNTAILYYSQNRYRNPSTAIGRAARILLAHAPASVIQFKFVCVENGLPVAAATIPRKALEQAVLGTASAEELWYRTKIDEGSWNRPKSVVFNNETLPGFSWSFDPKLRQHIGGGDKLYFWQLWGKLKGEIKLSPGLSIDSAIGLNLLNNYDDLQQSFSDSQLSHVRSDAPVYIKQSTTWLEDLTMTYVHKIAPAWYGRVTAGVFEMMYSGVSSEVLYRPVDQRWALGLDINHVRQRDYDGLFGHLDYQTTTGHLSYYHHLPYKNVNLEVSVGRYLARDVGGTFKISRTFDNGTTIGGWVTKTDVSAQEFGEGSFDKGIFLSIPLELFSTKPSRSTGSFTWRPLSRDGGQKVHTPKRLYGMTDGIDKYRLDTGWKDVME